MSLSKSYPVVTTFDETRSVLRSKWIITGLSDILANEVSSGYFSPMPTPYKLRFKLVLGRSDDFSRVGLHLDFEAMFSLSGTFDFGVEDKDGKETIKNRVSRTYPSDFRIGFPKLLAIDQIKDFVKSDGSVMFFVEIDYATFKCVPRTQFNLVRLCRELNLTLDSTDYSDVVFLVGYRSINAHKVIIANCSKILKDLIDDSARSQSNVIEIVDFEFDVFRGILEFIYNGVVEFTRFEFALNLRIAAEKYEIVELAGICEDYIVSYVDKKTAAKSILSTSLVVSKRIREACLKVFKPLTSLLRYKEIDNFHDVFLDPNLGGYVFDCLIGHPM